MRLLEKNQLEGMINPAKAEKQTEISVYFSTYGKILFGKFLKWQISQFMSNTDISRFILHREGN